MRVTTEATVLSRPLPYHDDIPLSGVLYRLSGRDEPAGPRPGILLIHGGAGLDDHAHGQARRYAALGYTVLAADLYGEEVTGDRERTMARITAFRDDPALLTRRAEAGLTALQDSPESGPAFAAVGFCFGGTAALTLARAGVALAGVVSMHGGLATTVPARPGTVRAKVLACHGSADPHVPMSDVTAFAREMDDAGADWELLVHGRALHGFTHTNAAPGAIPGVAYDATADRHSFAAATAFLAEVLEPSAG